MAGAGEVGGDADERGGFGEGRDRAGSVPRAAWSSVDLMDELGDPYPFYDRLRRESPVHRVGGSRFHLVSSWDLVAEAAARPADFSSNLTATMMVHPDGAVTEIELAALGDAGHVLATGDDPLHRSQRAMVLPALTAAWLLATRPELAAMLRTEPDLIPVFVEEVLRLESPFRGHYRHVVADTTLAFGRGIHFCVGAALARMEARAAIGMLLRRTRDFRAVAPAPSWAPSHLVRRLSRLDLTLA